MSADAIHGDLSTPAGIQVLFGHDQERQAVGRVLSMGFGDGQCRGVIELNEDDLKTAVAGGFESLESGINNGLSLGLTYLDGEPKLRCGRGHGRRPRHPRVSEDGGARGLVDKRAPFEASWDCPAHGRKRRCRMRESIFVWRAMTPFARA